MAFYRQACRRLWFTGAVLAALGNSLANKPAMSVGPSEVFVLGGHSDGPVRLGSSPKRFDISDDVLKTILQRLRERDDRRLYVVIDDIRRGEPLGIFYHVFFAAAGHGVEPLQDNDHVGSFNLFERYQRFVSFDVTDQFQRLVARPSAKLAVTIQPALGGTASERESLAKALDDAPVIIGGVRLALQ